LKLPLNAELVVCYFPIGKSSAKEQFDARQNLVYRSWFIGFYWLKKASSSLNNRSFVAFIYSGVNIVIV